MDNQSLNIAIKKLKDNLGDALLSSSIWSKEDCFSLASYNSTEDFVPLLGNNIKNLEQVLTEIGLPTFGNYQFIELDMDTFLLIINFEGEYFWGNIIDKSKVTIGLLFHIIIPKAVNYLGEAIINIEN